MKYPNLVLFEPDDQLRLHKSHHLTRKGLSVIPCATPAQLYDSLDQEKLEGTPEHPTVSAVFTRSRAHPRAMLQETLKRLRSRYAVMLIVESDDLVHDRLRILEGGADVCVSEGCTPAELLAVIGAMHKFVTSHTKPLSLLALQTHDEANEDTNEYEDGNDDQDSNEEEDSNVDQDSNDDQDSNEDEEELPVREMSKVSQFRLNDREKPIRFRGDPTPLSWHDVGDSRLSTGHGYGASDSIKHDHAHAYGEWQLSFLDWVIINPRGVHIGLTGVERDFFDALLRNDRRELSRKTMSEDGIGFKSISVIVSRMRKKIGLAGCPLPLHTVHGMGYVFIGTLNRQPAA